MADTKTEIVVYDGTTTGELIQPDGPVPADYPSRCARLMFDHYRAHGFTGSPRVLEGLLGRPARTFAGCLASLVPDAEPTVPAGPLRGATWRTRST